MADEPRTEPTTPKSLNDILADLKGFGIEDFEQPITLKSGNREIQIKLANIPSEEENMALLAVEEFKGYTWLQKVKAEILSRAISAVNGVEIHRLEPTKRRVVDPLDGMEKDIQVVLRNLIDISWGQEFMQALWKVLMVHSQGIEDRLLESFPEAATMTEAERRLTERARKEVEDATREVIQDQVAKLFSDDESKES